MNKKAGLIIMDGWGKGKVPSSDAIRAAHTPFVDSLYERYAHSELITCGTDVGLPDGQMGNSEVGHLNLGAGRIVYQELERINVAIRSGELANNTIMRNVIRDAQKKNQALHLMGLVSDGGVHSHIDHLLSIIDICKENNLSQVYIHAFLDGRDTDPNGGILYIKKVLEHCHQVGIGKVATIIGRYYAMDRDQRWERVALAYQALVHSQGIYTSDPIQAIRSQYEREITDEFIKPIIITEQDDPVAKITDGSTVLCFNFRTDRCREITTVLTQKSIEEMKPLNLHYTTMTEYDKNYRDVHVIFQKEDLTQTLGEVISNAGLTQVRIAETEKYPHVTFFFSGGREEPFSGEHRIMIPSPKDVATYDLKPQMSAYEITDAAIKFIEDQQPNFVCLNYANADMVGHTGVWEAAIKACETVDACVQKLVTIMLEHGYEILLTADHGNSDYMINEDGSVNTAHTLNPVPLFHITNGPRTRLAHGKLGDIAPTICRLLGLEQSAEMTGVNLINEQD